MIHELLTEGRETPTTGRQLAEYFKTDIRHITQRIEQERREGHPICAATGENPGYYLAATPEELEHYCNQLHNRASEMFKTRQALINVLRQIRDRQQEA